MTDAGLTGCELRSTIASDGTLRLDLVEVALAEPGPDEVIVEVRATPINPSDLGLLLGPADLSTLQSGGTADRPVLTAQVPAARLAGLRARIDQSMPVGNEGAGTVVRAGSDAQHLLGRTVAMLGGAMYTRYRKLPARDCVPLPEGVSAAAGASMFVNPLTALAMVETMRREGHKALVHTAAASNLGQMLNRICIADGVPLVNIVRKPEQAAILREIGARHIVDSNAPDFRDRLTDAIAETGATLAFDAISGGRIVNTILHAMEAAANRSASEYSRYGSSTFKQVYIYGMLDTGVTELDRGYGFAWSVSGFLLTPFLQKVGRDVAQQMRERVLREIGTTFASHYTSTISLAQALDPEVLLAYARKGTGEKFLIDPSL